MSEQNKSPVGVGAPNRTLIVDLSCSAVGSNVVQTGIKSKRHACYQGILEEYCYRVTNAVGMECARALEDAALVVAHLVVAGELDDNYARWWLECTALSAELWNFSGMIDAMFLAAEADFEKHSGAGLPYDG